MSEQSREYKDAYNQRKREKYQQDKEYQEEKKKQNRENMRERRKDPAYHEREVLYKWNSRHDPQRLEDERVRRLEWMSSPERREHISQYKSTHHRLNRLKKYGITHNDYHDMYEQQGGKCKICRTSIKNALTEENKQSAYQTCVDHDHTTGKVRGLLCWNCNIALGRFNEDIPTFERAILYLKGEL